MDGQSGLRLNESLIFEMQDLIFELLTSAQRPKVKTMVAGRRQVDNGDGRSRLENKRWPIP